MSRAALLILLALAGCGHQPPREVLVPTPVACIDRRPDRPVFMTDAELTALDDHKFVLLLWSERAALRSYTDRLQVLVDLCSRIPGATR